MTESPRETAGRERLLAADTTLTDDELATASARLAGSVQDLEAAASRSRRLVIRAWSATALCYFCGFVLTSMSALNSPPGKLVAGIWVAVSWAAMITAVVSSVRYWCIHRPALERIRTDLQIAMFQELQRQLQVLAARLNKTT